jgi:predicted MFS family arabinose efflux permease
LAIALVCGALLGGWWADRWSRTDPRGRIFVPMAGICLAAPGVFLLSWADTLPLAIFGVVLYGGRNFTDANMMPMLCLVTDPRYRATGFGILNLVANTIGGLAIYAGGALRDAHVAVHYIYRGAAVGVAVCFFLYLLVLRSAARAKTTTVPPA